MPSNRPSHNRDHQLWNSFTVMPPPPGATERRVSCLYCDDYRSKAANSSRMRDHLFECKPYFKNPLTQDHDIVKSKKRLLQEEQDSRPLDEFFQPKASASTYKQTKLAIPKLLDSQKALLTELAALAMYVGGKPLSFYEETYLRLFIQHLNPAYSLPTRRAFSEELLDAAYNKLKDIVVEVIKATPTINLITDGSSNINHDRMTNISLHADVGALYLETLQMDFLKHGGQETADYIDTQIRAWLNDDLSRVNSIATDTENTMRSFISCLNQKPGWGHVFWSPCDSHGIQLLMQHISGLPWFEDLFKRAGNIVTFFWKAEKQLETLRKHQKAAYGRHYALTLSVLTRWGTQYRLIDSLLRSQQALFAWASDTNRDTSSGSYILRIIQDPQFWADLRGLKEILRPIHEHQIQSESLHAGVGQVLKRWNSIKAHLQGLKNRPNYPYSNQIDSIFQPQIIMRNGLAIRAKAVWKSQYDKQILPIHHLAYHLDPNSIAEDLRDTDQNAMLSFLTDHTPGTDQDKQKCRSQFLAYKYRRPPFTQNHSCWIDRADVLAFWTRCLTIAPELGHLAIRIFTTAGNSVACERAFSVMNLLHNKARNRTSIDKMDKLMFIYINCRVLRYRNDKPTRPDPPPDKPDGSNKRRKLDDTENNTSWLVLDEDTELAVEEEHLPVEQIDVLQKERPSEAVDDIELDDEGVTDEL